MNLMVVLAIAVALILGVGALSTLAPPRYAWRHLWRRPDLFFRQLAARWRGPIRSPRWTSPWPQISVLLGCFAIGMLAVLLARAGEAPPPNVEAEQAAQLGWDAAAIVTITWVFLLSILLVFLNPKSSTEKVATVTSATAITALFYTLCRPTIRIVNDIGLDVCLLCFLSGEPVATAAETNRLEMILSSRAGTVLECPQDARSRIGPFKSGKHEVMDIDQGAEPLVDAVGAAVAALRDRAAERTLEAFVIIGSADEMRLSSRARRKYGSNAGLARQRAEAIAKALPTAQGSGVLGAPPIVIFGGDFDLVRWAEGDAETLSGREARLCALWRPGWEASNQAGGAVARAGS